MKQMHTHEWSRDHSQHRPPSAAQGVIAAVVGWSLAWKGLSLWRAAKDDSKPWFVALLASNTLGVLDAIYLFGVSPHRRRAEPELVAVEITPPTG